MIQRTPPAGVIERWQPELDRIAQPTDRGHSHLMLVWESGEEWAPVERWVIYEMMRPEQSYLDIWLDLDGPPPRSFGRYDTAKRRFVRTRSSMISQHQWELYRETGRFGRPVWIVQGEKGGHKRNWTDVEQNLAMIHCNTTEEMMPPAPGDLCYAEPDQRTVTLLHGLDLVHRFGDLLRVLSNDEFVRNSLDRRDRDMAQEMARLTWAWLGDQVEESLTFTRDQANEVWDNADPDGALTDYDVEEDDFITEVAEAASF